MNLLGIKIRMTAGFHHQANGQAERTNQTLRQYLRGIRLQGLIWVNSIATAEIAMNNANSTGTNFTPYLLNLGYHPCVYPDVEWSTPPVDSVTSSPAKNVAKTLKKQWKIAHKILQDHKDAVT